MIKKYKKISIILIKVLLAILLFYLLWKQINNKTTWEEIISLYKSGFKEGRFKWFLLALLLVPINWGTEVFKWKKVIRKVYPITLILSTKAVLLGIVFSMYTPNRVGEYGGRVVLLKSKRWDAFFATMMGSISQIAANTFWSGCLSLMYIHIVLPKFEYKNYYIPIIILSIVSTLLLFLFINHISRLNFNLPFFKTINRGIEVFKLFNFRDKSSLYFISSTRFFVYVLQYYCLLLFFDIQIPFVYSIVSIGCLFFVQTIIPTVALVELGIRGIISLQVFGYLSDNVAGIFDATFTLWILNLVLPSILGIVVLMKTNINLQEEGSDNN